MKIDAVIVTYNRLEKLKKAREALQRVTFDVAQNTVNQKDYNQGYYAKKGIKLIKKNKQ